MAEKEKVSCVACQGSGKCSRCDGAGNVVQNLPSPIAVVSGEVRGMTKSSKMCSLCFGSGICQSCKGSGKASK